jgi:hypothetical protein
MSISFAILSQIYVLLQLLPKKITPKCSQLMKIFVLWEWLGVEFLAFHVRKA